MRTDTELVNAVLDGENQAFAVLVERYERPVRAVAMSVLRRRQATDDIAQDAFIKAYENLPKLRKTEAFGPWLMKITSRFALEAAQQKPKESPLEAATSAIGNPAGQLDEDNQKLLAAVVKLPRAEKQVIMLRYFGGNNVKDVADILGRGLGTVTKQLSRAHKRLRNI
ncbi:MAG: sigma-70 family RNA polymerase sigma factor [Sedimentisphaerales bacterium]|nr:sigma-70 family RNA polymerase sigma factor [Sedimentisphaerales bacterium]